MFSSGQLVFANHHTFISQFGRIASSLQDGKKMNNNFR
tara:strand:- start:963 stop:1076 length:114 start_codon:yes stop_codon:yes gene_type:complete